MTWVSLEPTTLMLLTASEREQEQVTLHGYTANPLLCQSSFVLIPFAHFRSISCTDSNTHFMPKRKPTGRVVSLLNVL